MTRCHETEVEHRAHNPKVADLTRLLLRNSRWGSVSVTLPRPRIALNPLSHLIHVHWS